MEENQEVTGGTVKSEIMNPTLTVDEVRAIERLQAYNSEIKLELEKIELEGKVSELQNRLHLKSLQDRKSDLLEDRRGNIDKLKAISKDIGERLDIELPERFGFSEDTFELILD